VQTTQLKTIEHYETTLDETVREWSAAQRGAFAAAMAERWLPAYEQFSAAENWGDAPGLRRILDPAWNHAIGRPLTPADRARYEQQLQVCTPHMDDFDAPRPRGVCRPPRGPGVLQGPRQRRRLGPGRPEWVLGLPARR
jgi:hypothetical protein